MLISVRVRTIYFVGGATITWLTVYAGAIPDKTRRDNVEYDALELVETQQESWEDESETETCYEGEGKEEKTDTGGKKGDMETNNGNPVSGTSQE